jgi:uncharacterized protein (DUF2236 family)
MEWFSNRGDVGNRQNVTVRQRPMTLDHEVVAVAADPGLFGPRSVSWQVHSDPAMWLAGIRSLYLQALHPRVVAGVIQNSDFQQDPLGRLLRTANFVGVSTYGCTEEARALAARVRGIHRSLRLTDPDTGTAHRVDEPDLLLWVHCAEVASFLGVTVRAGYRLSAAQIDRYYDEQRRTAELVGLRGEEVPGSAAEMTEYFAAMRPSLRAGQDAATIYRFLHRPPLPAKLRPGLLAYQPLAGHLAFSLLPRWAARLYGHRPYPGTVATTMLRTFRTAALLAPPGTPYLGRGPHVQGAVDRIGPRAVPSRANLASG